MSSKSESVVSSPILDMTIHLSRLTLTIPRLSILNVRNRNVSSTISIPLLIPVKI